MKITHSGLAGTLESSDVMVRIDPSTEPDLRVELDSLVKAQFGVTIEKLIKETLNELGIMQARVTVNDKGALDCVIRARVQAAAFRAAGKPQSEWSLT